VPTSLGGIIDEVPGPGHSAGNQHTVGSGAHPNASIFNDIEGGNKIRQSEISEHWNAKGTRLVQGEDGMWYDSGYDKDNSPYINKACKRK